MTQDDIIWLAKKSGIAKHGLGWTCWEGQLERFAQLVAAHEREKVAKWMIERSYATGHGDTIEDLLNQLEWQVRERELEECAKVADKWAVGWPHPSTVIAEEIRARGDK